MRTLLALALVLVTGCETPQIEPLRPGDIASAALLRYIVDGSTTREQVLLQFGTPSAQYEDERILTYQLRVSPDGTPEIFWPRRSEVHPMLTSWQAGVFSLVLVFDDDGVLRKHSLVGAR